MTMFQVVQKRNYKFSLIMQFLRKQTSQIPLFVSLLIIYYHYNVHLQQNVLVHSLNLDVTFLQQSHQNLYQN